MDSSKKEIKSKESSKENLDHLKNKIVIPNQVNEINSNLNEKINSSKKNSPSPDIKKAVTANPITKPIIDTNKNIPNKLIPGKGLNIIPIKNLNLTRDVNDKDKHQENKIPTLNINNTKFPASNLSPSTRNKVILPISNKNTTNNIGFEPNKYSNKVYENIVGNLKYKSPSPKHTEVPKMVYKKSPEIKK